MSSLPWPEIDTVLLDMDGTLLDLHFDNHFWLTHLPRRLAQWRAISQEQAMALLEPLFREHAGTLNWYCTDFWSQALELPIPALKREVAHLIAWRPQAETFLGALKDAGKQVLLITNAHRDSLNLKTERVALAPYFEQLISSHDYGYPKEDQRFWQALREATGFAPARSLFVDDSLPVLRSARAYGVAHLLAVREPDSQGAPKDSGEFTAIEQFADWLEGL